MKDADKVTMTIGQLKKLIKESFDNKELIYYLDSSLDYALQTSSSDYEQMFINELANSFCKNDGIRDGIKSGMHLETGKEPKQEDVDAVMTELLKQFGSEENIRKYVKEFILNDFIRNKKYLFTDDKSEYINSNLTFADYFHE